MTRRLLRKGSAKDVFWVFSQRGTLRHLEFMFSNRVSVFGRGPIPVEFTGLGKVRCAIAGYIFQMMKQEGFLTQYLSHDSATATMQVSPLNVAELNLDFGSTAVGRLYPAELLFRGFATQGVVDRVSSGALDGAKLDRYLEPDAKLLVGARFNPWFCEATTKFEESDRYLSHAEAAELMGVSKVQLDIIFEQDVREAASFLRRMFQSVGYELLDGKFECGELFSTGKLTFADSISPDELRIVGQDGLRFDKDLIRQWYECEQADWVARLRVAKQHFPNDSTKWPAYEAVPPVDVIEVMVSRYRQFGRAIGAI